MPLENIKKYPAGSQKGKQNRKNRHPVRAAAADGAAEKPCDNRPRQGRKRHDQVERFHPFRESKSSTSMVLRFLNSTTRIARPIADSAAATVRLKNTNTCPAMLPR